MISHKNFWNNDWGFVWLLGIMLTTIVTTQFSEGLAWADILFIRVSFFIIMVMAIRSSVLSSFTKKTGFAVSIAILLFSFVLVEENSNLLILTHSILITTFMIFILILLVKQIFGSGKMTLQKIGGGIAIYIIIGQVWAELYVTIFQLSPESFQFSEGNIVPETALQKLSYFSFVTLTTIGFGDITAVGSSARVLVILEGLIGQLFPAIFIAKLVSQQIEDTRKKRSTTS